MFTTFLLSTLVMWSAPTERVNGDKLTPEEIGGYEFRWKNESTGIYEYIIIRDRTAVSYELPDELDGRCIWELAVYDSNGIYSDYVHCRDIERVDPTPIRAPKRGGIR